MECKGSDEMILIRGIKGESYAKRIEKGIVDCRDILSALLQPPKTGYEYSDYYEKNLVKALSYMVGKERPDLHEPEFLYSLLIDYYIPHIYVTYFHILNDRSLEWLDKFDDDYQFIAVDAKLDRLTKTAIGEEYFGDRMTYANSIRECSQDGYRGFQTACICSIEDLVENKKEILPSVNIYNTLAFSLLCRERDEKFTDIENEFRIIAYDCPVIYRGQMQQKPRETTIYGKTGTKYKGVLEAWKDTIFTSNSCFLNSQDKRLSNIIETEQGNITLDSSFKAIDISLISDDYRFLSGKEECAEYIKKMIARRPKEKYVNRTRIVTRNINEMKNMLCIPGHEDIEY